MTYIKDHKDDAAIFINGTPKEFRNAIAKHRNWDRMEIADKIPV